MTLLLLVGSCPPVPVVDNAFPDTTDALYGSVVTYTCNPGYTFYNENQQTSLQKSITCGEDEIWIGNITLCEGTLHSLVNHFK